MSIAAKDLLRAVMESEPRNVGLVLEGYLSVAKVGMAEDKLQGSCRIVTYIIMQCHVDLLVF